MTEQEHTFPQVSTQTANTMSESIDEKKKEELKQAAKKEEPKVQENERCFENNGREEFFIDHRIPHFTPHDNAPTKSTSLNTSSSAGSSTQSISSRNLTKS
ncbi:hypothetical protein BLNAU_2166 [Blattamonas nauphoetae]|uniref:Uncharacterized protein n=1 Tax=Blattamonas nauphoetae TaxID=2049346 RepID=A0ABQ9YG34_9EUKA|nr:hypothetical protein BLNAU_2166 [Blattamonas nauphoetae]